MKIPGRNHRYFSARPKQFELIRPYAKSNRLNPTAAEHALWLRLKGNKLAGFHFRRQHVIGSYVVDFVCLQRYLVVEVDGGYHFTGDMPARDAKRTARLNEMGFRIMRFTNEEVLNTMHRVLHSITQVLLNP
jgi:very-short-patch-repair endonuclease